MTTSAKRSIHKDAGTVSAHADTPPLLDYRFSPSPDPIQISTPQGPATGRLNIAALSGKQKVYCSQIVIAVPVGAEAGDLYSATPSASVNTPRWGITSTAIKKGTELGRDDALDYATFIFDCANPADYLIDYNLVFGLSGSVATVAGDYAVIVGETSGTTSNPNDFTTKKATFTLRTILPQFYLQNFLAVAPNAPTVPATDFANGADIRFEWESNGTFFQLFKAKEAKPIYAGTATTFTLAGGASRDTSFVLIAWLTGDPGQGTAPGYEPIYLCDSLGITISNPDLTPRSVETTGKSTVGGDLDVTGNSTLKGTLGVTNTANFGTANANTLTVSDQANLATAKDARVGIGTATPAAKLEIALDGASQHADVLRVGKGSTSYLKIQSDGFVGVGATNAADPLDVNGNLRVASGSNPIRFTGVYTGFPDGAKNHAEICNSTDPLFQSLMIVGNQSKPSSGRNVSIWDNLHVNGSIIANNLQLNASAYGTFNIWGGKFSTSWNGPPNFSVNADGVAYIVKLYMVNNWSWWTRATDAARPRTWYRVANDPTGSDDALLHHYRRDVNFSDARLHQDVRRISGALETISRLQGSVFRWNDAAIKHFTDGISDLVKADDGATPEEHQKVQDLEREAALEALADEKVGLIATEDNAATRALTHTDRAGYRHIQYRQVTALLVEALKEQNSLVEKLSARVAALEAR
jgi:hypothetical protein